MSDFVKAAGIRALRTMAQTAVALIGTNAIGVTEVNWMGVASGAALAGIVSVLTSIATGLPRWTSIPSTSATAASRWACARRSWPTLAGR